MVYRRCLLFYNLEWVKFCHNYTIISLFCIDQALKVICTTLMSGDSVLQLLMLLWCYFAVVFTDPGGVPQTWRPSPSEEDLEVQSLPLAPTPSPSASGMNLPAMSQSPRVRYCRKCCQFKPPRCHHCSVCECNSWASKSMTCSLISMYSNEPTLHPQVVHTAYQFSHADNIWRFISHVYISAVTYCRGNKEKGDGFD